MNLIPTPIYSIIRPIPNRLSGLPRIHLEARIIGLAQKDTTKTGRFCLEIFRELRWSNRAEEELTNLYKTFGGKRETMFIAKSGQAVVGCVGIKCLGQKEGVIRHFYIHKEFRGTGLANLLLARLKKFAKAKDYRLITIGVSKKNLRAQNFFEKNEFNQLEITPNEKWPESQTPGRYIFYQQKI